MLYSQMSWYIIEPAALTSYEHLVTSLNNKYNDCILGSVGTYGTGNGTGNPVHLFNPNHYPTCVLTNPNFRCVCSNWHMAPHTTHNMNSLRVGLQQMLVLSIWISGCPIKQISGKLVPPHNAFLWGSKECIVKPCMYQLKLHAEGGDFLAYVEDRIQQQTLQYTDVFAERVRNKSMGKKIRDPAGISNLRPSEY